MDAGEYLGSILYTRKEVEDWFAGHTHPYWKYDSELGYLHRNARLKDGVDGSISTFNYSDYGSGARRMIMYSNKPCRVNTYGNSFTNCSQVSDGETWQEILGAHLCEPIRNFGVGGYSVYQAFLRMKREEKQTPAEYIIFNIFDDDHYRNLHAWQNIRTGHTPETRIGLRIFTPTVPHVKVNPATGEFVECGNISPTPEHYYRLCDLDWVCKTFKDSFVLKIMLAHLNVKEGNPEKSYADIRDLALKQGIETQIDNSEKLNKTADALYERAAIFASMRIVEKVEEFAAANGKKVLYVLSFGSGSIAKRIRDNYRFDQKFVDFLQKKGLPYVDLMEAHITDYNQFKTSVEDYLERYFGGTIGHYNPRGNFFHAFAIKDKVVEMLEPKPTPYLGYA